jgi:hypothetical protein
MLAHMFLLHAFPSIPADVHTCKHTCIRAIVSSHGKYYSSHCTFMPRYRPCRSESLVSHRWHFVLTRRAPELLNEMTAADFSFLGELPVHNFCPYQNVCVCVCIYIYACVNTYHSPSSCFDGDASRLKYHDTDRTVIYTVGNHHAMKQLL